MRRHPAKFLSELGLIIERYALAVAINPSEMQYLA